MMVGLVMVFYFFTILKDKPYFTPNEENARLYNENGMICKYPFFNTWRRYEFIHTFFWLLKDYAWCANDRVLWIVGAVPTLYVSIDFILVTMKNRKVFIDLTHYIAQLLWVSSNLIWAFVEVFGVLGDTAESYAQLNHPDGRLVAAFVLVLAYVPIVLLYMVWVPLTVLDKIDEEEMNSSSDSTHFELVTQDSSVSTSTDSNSNTSIHSHSNSHSHSVHVNPLSMNMNPKTSIDLSDI